MSLIACRPLKAGEEITVSYTDLAETREIRRARLMSAYYFNCECEYCSRSEKEVAASDSVRLEIKAREKNKGPQLGEWSRNLSLPDDHLIKYHKRGVDQHEKEGLYDYNHAVH